jgi:hypothetical protein
VADSSIYFLDKFSPTQSQENIKHNETSFLLYMYNIVRGGLLRHYLNTVYSIDTVNTTFVRVHGSIPRKNSRRYSIVTSLLRFDSVNLQIQKQDDIRSSIHTNRFQVQFLGIKFTINSTTPKTIFDRQINTNRFPVRFLGKQIQHNLLCFYLLHLHAS